VNPQVCDLTNIFGVFNFWSPESQSKNSVQDDQSRAVGNADGRRNKFEAVRRFTPMNGSAGNPPPSPRQGSFRGDAFKNVKFNPELEATRRRVEEELYIKNLKAAEIEEDKVRLSSSANKYD
jgi:hypothetical protein